VAQPQVQVRHLHRGGPVAGVQSARPLFLRGGPVVQVQVSTRCVSVATAQEPPRAPTSLFRAVRWLSFRRRAHIFYRGGPVAGVQASGPLLLRRSVPLLLRSGPVAQVQPSNP